MEDSLSQPNYMHYINFIKHIIEAIIKMQKEYSIPVCDVFPDNYNDIMELYDDLCRYKDCNNTLKEWTRSRYCTKYLNKYRKNVTIE